jgi:hypothetical protein
LAPGAFISKDKRRREILFFMVKMCVKFINRFDRANVLVLMISSNDMDNKKAGMNVRL